MPTNGFAAQMHLFCQSADLEAIAGRRQHRVPTAVQFVDDRTKEGHMWRVIKIYPDRLCPRRCFFHGYNCIRSSYSLGAQIPYCDLPFATWHDPLTSTELLANTT